MSGRCDSQDEVLDQAVAWHQTLAHADPDWEGYLAWLEAAPANRAAYDEIALLDRAIDQHADDLLARWSASVPEPSPSHATSHDDGHGDDGHGDDAHSDKRRRGGARWWIGGGALAAALALVLVVSRLFVADAVYQTAPGESRQIALGDGETVRLAPASRLVARRGDPHRLELAQGEAFFTVTHDPSRTLSITAGGFAVTDIGTRFGVKLADDSVTVSVAEGRVTMQAGNGQTRQVAAGQQLLGSDGTLPAPRGVAVQDVGSWRDGRLVYDHTPLRVVIADLARFSGRRVTVDPGIGDRLFSGALVISDGSRTFQDLADLMGISFKMDGRDVRFVANAAR